MTTAPIRAAAGRGAAGAATAAAAAATAAVAAAGAAVAAAAAVAVAAGVAEDGVTNPFRASGLSTGPDAIPGPLTSLERVVGAARRAKKHS